MHFMENWLIFLGIWGEAELFLGIWGAKANNFREKRKLFSGSLGDQCIIFRDLGSTYTPWGASFLVYFNFDTVAFSQMTLRLTSKQYLCF